VRALIPASIVPSILAASFLFMPISAQAAAEPATTPVAQADPAVPLSVEEIARRAAGPQTPADGAPKISCVRPTPPGQIPDGRNATSAEMQAAQKAVKDFIGEAEKFQSCLIQAQQQGRGLTVATYLMMEQLYGQTQIQMQALAARFNEQLKIYKVKNR